MNLKSSLVAALKNCPPLFRFTSRLYHRLNSRFRTLSPGTPEAIARAFELVRQERGDDVGDYYEFGLFRGYTLLAAFRECERLGLHGMHLYGFDSFRGLPDLDDQDSPDARFFSGQFAASRDRVEKDLTRRGIDWSRVELIEGFFEDSLTEELKASLPRKNAAVVLLDCDLYSSTATALRWVDDLLMPGSVLLFDDWASYDGREDVGQPRAFSEFLSARSQWRADDFGSFSKHGKAFVLRATER